MGDCGWMSGRLWVDENETGLVRETELMSGRLWIGEKENVLMRGRLWVDEWETVGW